MSIALPVRLKQTSSLCPACRRQIDAEVVERDGKVYLHKQCPEHGFFEVLINSDRRFYHLSLGASASQGCCGGACGAGSESFDGEQVQRGHNPAIIEKASTCIALIEIVDSCNLKCPTCFAASPFDGPTPQPGQYLSLEEFWQRIGSVLARKGAIDILQLSGGEPTIHPQFLELLESVLKDPRIGYTLINTNGVRLAHDRGFVDALGELRRRYKRLEIYLQFDGVQEAGQVALRGADLRAVRQKALDHTGAHGLITNLAMTVNEQNLDSLGEAMRFGLSQRCVRGLTFQAMFRSGRVQDEAEPVRRINVSDILLGLIEQSEGLLAEADFTPLPCGDPNCHTIGYVLRRGGEILPVSRFIDFSQVQGFLKDRVNFSWEDLSRCGCESEPLGEMLRQLEIGPDNVFRLFIKPFMDAWTYDQDRIDRCCVHVVGEGGKLESFCRHYALRG